jgi:hypothetical protein
MIHATVVIVTTNKLLSSTGGIERVDICSWKRVKYLGTKTQYEKRKAGSVRNSEYTENTNSIIQFWHRNIPLYM